MGDARPQRTGRNEPCWGLLLLLRAMHAKTPRKGRVCNASCCIHLGMFYNAAGRGDVIMVSINKMPRSMTCRWLATWTLASLSFLAATVLGGCRREPPATKTAPEASATATVPSVAAAPSATATASPRASANECAAYLSASGPRSLGYHLPGDPAAHPGCAINEAGALQCPMDFAGWTPRSRVTVPRTETRALLDESERAALATGCAECPRGASSEVGARTYLPGYDPSAYPVRLCKNLACIEVCGAAAKQSLVDLRARFAATRVATKEEIGKIGN